MDVYEEKLKNLFLIKMNLINFRRIQENGANKCTSKASIKAINCNKYVKITCLEGKTKQIKQFC